MIKLAIRDDDANYFTKVSDLESIYKELSFFPISFAVVPYVTDVLGGCPDTFGNSTPRWVGDNRELIDWLKCKVEKGECDILMHGISHEYHLDDMVKIPEMIWRKDEDLKNRVSIAKHEMESLFDYIISVFVAPSNKISKNNLQCIVETGMDFSGIIPISFQRKFTFRNICSYFKRWFFRVKDRLPFPNILYYSDHKEINACTMQGYNYLVKMFQYCERISSPMVINVHYWHLRDNPKVLQELVLFVNYALEHGAIPSTVSTILSSERPN